VPYLGPVALQQHLAPADLDRLGAQDKRRGRCPTAGVTCRGHDCCPALHDGVAHETLANLHGLLHGAPADAVECGKVKRAVVGLVETPGSDQPTHRCWSPDVLRAFVTHVRADRLLAT
jgi:hypothetical protein